MSEGFTVDLDLLAEVIDRMARTGARLTAAEEEVDARLRRLHAAWRGEAATLHAEAHRRWVTGMRQMRDALQNVRGVAHTAEGNYRAASRANLQMWAQ